MTARATPTNVGSRKLDLKWALTLRVVAVAVACFVVAATLTLYGTYRELRRANDNVADIVVRQLQMQLFRIDLNLDVLARFPDWDPVAAHVLDTGQCVQFIKPDGNFGRSSCVGVNLRNSQLPSWVSSLGTSMLGTHADIARPISYRGKAHGTLLVTTEPAVIVAELWKGVAGLLTLTAALVGAICLLQYIAISRALRPTKEILAGLDGLSRGDLSCRLPSFSLVELGRISEVFNTLAESLELTTRERTRLAARLVDRQEDERSHLARELHDELAQSLSAINAAAASIKATAENECPTLLPEADRLSQTAMTAMRSLRATLHTLRPPEIDDFGLRAALSALVSDQERRSGGKLKITIEINGDLHDLSSAAASHVYRIIQEGLTNIGKHSNASRARIVLDFRGEPPDRSCRSTPLAGANHRRRWIAEPSPTTPVATALGLHRHARARDGARREIECRPTWPRLHASSRHSV